MIVVGRLIMRVFKGSGLFLGNTGILLTCADATGWKIYEAAVDRPYNLQQVGGGSNETLELLFKLLR